jgi:SAM-dependent methyltransferase
MTVVGRVNRKDAEKLHPEIKVDNISVDECDLSFYSIIRSIVLRYGVKDVLDYGAGRNQYEADFDPLTRSFLVRDLRDLRAGGCRVVAADISSAVMSHPTSHQQILIDSDGCVALPDNSFDLIVSDYVFEHIEDPGKIAHELQRLLRPGGWLAIRTPNAWGYLRVASSIVPNRLHNAALRFVQPHRNTVDTFPTYYRLNTLSAMRRHFDACDTVCVTGSWEPAYFFGKVWLYRLMQVAHRLLPRRMGTAHIFLAQKRIGE